MITIVAEFDIKEDKVNEFPAVIKPLEEASNSSEYFTTIVPQLAAFENSVTKVSESSFLACNIFKFRSCRDRKKS